MNRTGTTRRRPPAVGALVAFAGLVLLVACGLAVGDGTVGPAERDMFHAVNDLPGWLYPVLWVFQQCGNVVVAFVLVVAVSVLMRRPAVAMAAVAGVMGKLVLERVVKAVVERERPGTSIGDVVLRGEVPVSGLSFVSGHVVITTAFATMLMALLPHRWRPVPWVIVVLNGLGRVYVGAHNPLDVVGGVGLGLTLGGALYAGVATWTSRSHVPVEVTR